MAETRSGRRDLWFFRPAPPEPIAPAAYRRFGIATCGVAAFFLVGNALEWLWAEGLRHLEVGRLTVWDWTTLVLLLIHLLAAAAAASMVPERRTESARRALAYIVLLLEIFATALVVYPEGSVTSSLSQWFTLAIVFTRLYFDARLGLFVLSTSVALQAGMVGLEVAKVIPAHPRYPTADLPNYASAGVEIGHAFWLVVVYVGAWVLASYVAWRLRTSEAELRQLNIVLEDRVAAQVGEIQRRAADVDALNVQLAERVRERSRELTLALRRLAAADPRAADGVRLGSTFAGRVDVIRPLGAGGMGAVYLGTDRLTGRLVGLKLLHQAIATPGMLERFLTEAAAAAAVSHPGIVRTIHVDVSEGGRVYLLLEYVEGVSLDRRLDRGPLGFAKTARIGATIAGALAAAHAAGVVHRDVKPSNVLLCKLSPGAKILDFGIAKIVADAAGAGGLTEAGQLLGTPEYMSPEQARDPATIGPASDVYSLGVLLHRVAIGGSPYEEKGPAAGLLAHLRESAPALRAMRPDAPERLGLLVARCLQRDPRARPSTVDVATELEAIAGALGAPRTEELEDWAESTSGGEGYASTVAAG